MNAMQDPAALVGRRHGQRNRPGADLMETSEFKEIVAAVHRLIREQVVPREDEIEGSDAIPDDLRRKAVEMGLFGYTLPDEYGGLGLDAERRRAPGLRVRLHHARVPVDVRHQQRHRRPGPGQLPAPPSSRRRGCPGWPAARSRSFALTEPEAGSDPSGLSDPGRPGRRRAT